MRTFLPVAVMGLTMACDGGISGVATVVEHDSAGVRIVENQRMDSARIAWWSIGHPASVDIGDDAEGAAYALSQVTSAMRLSDGRIVVASAGSADVRYYDGGGTYRLTSGSRGGGPGEFRRPSALIRMPGDTLLVIDNMARRTTVLDANGIFVRSSPFIAAPGAPNSFPVISGRFADGSFFTVRTLITADEVIDGVQRPQLFIARVNAEGDEVNPITTVPGREQLIRIKSSNGDIQSISIGTPPFARLPLSAASGDRLFVATQDVPQVDVYTHDGTLTRIIRTGHAMVPRTSQHTAAWIDRSLEGLPADRQRDQREMLSGIPGPDLIPPYGDMLIDSSGNLWLQDYDDRLAYTGDWNVYRPDGRFIARIRLPAGIKVYDIGSDYVLGVERDDLDVEHVRVYRLDRADRPQF